MARSKSCSPLKGFFSSLATRTYALVAKREYKAAADVLCEPSGQGFLGEEEEKEAGTAELEMWFWLIGEILVTKSACFCNTSK